MYKEYQYLPSEILAFRIMIPYGGFPRVKTWKTFYAPMQIQFYEVMNRFPINNCHHQLVGDLILSTVKVSDHTARWHVSYLVYNDANITIAYMNHHNPSIGKQVEISKELYNWFFKVLQEEEEEEKKLYRLSPKDRLSQCSIM